MAQQEIVLGSIIALLDTTSQSSSLCASQCGEITYTQAILTRATVSTTLA